jgi:hypothetical protein
MRKIVALGGVSLATVMLVGGLATTANASTTHVVRAHTACSHTTHRCWTVHAYVARNATHHTTHRATHHKIAHRHATSTRVVSGATVARRFAHTRVLTLQPITAYHSQSTIDRCALDLWSLHPAILAGHNYCATHNWYWMANVAKGVVVHVPTGPARGWYVVVGHHHASTQGGTLPRMLRSYDLALQTCVGTGTTFTYANRVA